MHVNTCWGMYIRKHLCMYVQARVSMRAWTLLIYTRVHACMCVRVRVWHEQKPFCCTYFHFCKVILSHEWNLLGLLDRWNHGTGGFMRYACMYTNLDFTWTYMNIHRKTWRSSKAMVHRQQVVHMLFPWSKQTRTSIFSSKKKDDSRCPPKALRMSTDKDNLIHVYTSSFHKSLATTRSHGAVDPREMLFVRCV